MIIGNTFKKISVNIHIFISEKSKVTNTKELSIKYITLEKILWGYTGMEL